jgi:hypothetical protein
MKNRINELIERAENIKESNSNSDSPDFKAWNDDVLRFLKKNYGENSHEVNSFGEIEYYSLFVCTDFAHGYWNNDPHKEKECFQKGMETAILYLNNYLSDFSGNEVSQEPDSNQTIEKNLVFIVHGRNDNIKAQVSNLVLKLGLKPIVLHEQIKIRLYRLSCGCKLSPPQKKSMAIL